MGSNANAATENEREENFSTQCSDARRAFLRRGAVAAGAFTASGIALGLGASAKAQEGASSANSTADASAVAGVSAISNDLTLKMKEHSALGKVGGSQVVEAAGEKIIVAQHEAGSFAACSAVCPHKGAELQYSHSDKQFFCPLHNSRFGLDGSLQRGPAKRPLKSFATDSAVVVAIGPAKELNRG